MTVTDTAPAALVDRAVRAATRAPSVHNTQPWRFVVAPASVELCLDRTRVLAVDPGAREARISCGAALFNLRLAIEAAGRTAQVTLVSDPDRPDLLARVRVGGPRVVTAEERTLAAAIERRSTNRRPFLDRTVPTAHRKALRRAVRAERADLSTLATPKELTTLGVLLRRAEHLQEAHPAFRSELVEWTDVVGDREDGVPRWAGTPRPTGGTESVPGLRPFGHALVMMLTTRGDGPVDQLRAGLALQRMLLTATAAGLSVSLLTQPVENPYTRVALRTLLGAEGNPQAVLRVGYAAPATPTPRRPVTAVTVRTP